jgi:hypothetical protein
VASKLWHAHGVAVGNSDWQASRALRKRFIKGSAQASAGLFGLLVYGFVDRLVMFLVLGSAFLVMGATGLVPAIIERRRRSQMAQGTRDNL